MTPGRADRPTPAELEAAVAEARTVPDVIGPGLVVLFCGINPGRWSGAVGHHFAHPGNRFWKVLALAGFTDRQLGPLEERELLRYGIGITNLVDRTTAAASDLGRSELAAGAERLEEKVARFGPVVVAVVGLGAYRTAFARPKAALGRQDDTVGGAALWVLPNPSGLQAHYGLEDMVARCGALRRWVDHLA